MADSWINQIELNDIDKVHIGQIYNQYEKKLFETKETKIASDCCDSDFQFEVKSKKEVAAQIDQGATRKASLSKNYHLMESCPDALLVIGTKIRTIKGRDVPPHPEYCVVNSFSRKYKAKLILQLKKIVEEKDRVNLHKYLKGVVCGKSVSTIPSSIDKNFRSGFISIDTHSIGKEVVILKHCLQEFCRIVKEGTPAKIPVTAYLSKPAAHQRNSGEYIDDADMTNYRSASKEKQKLYADGSSNHNTSPTNFSPEEAHRKMFGSDPNMLGDYETPQSRQSGSNKHVMETNLDTIVPTHMPEKHGSQNQTQMSNFRDRQMADLTGTNALCESDNKQMDHEGNKIQESLGPCHQNNAQKDNCNISTGDPRTKISGGRQNMVHIGWNYDNDSQSEMQRKYSNGTSIKMENDEIQHMNMNSNKKESGYNLRSKRNYTDENVSKPKTQTSNCSPEDCNPITHESKVDNFGNSRETMAEVLKRNLQVPPPNDAATKTTFQDSTTKSKDVLPMSGETQIVQQSNMMKSLSEKGGEGHSAATFTKPSEQNFSKNTCEKSRVAKGKHSGLQMHKQTSKSERKGRVGITELLPPTERKEVCGIERKYYGVVNRDLPEKVIILLGASGCGKTTLLNFIANYFHGVKTADDQLIHVEANSNDCASRTRRIRAYTFCSKREDVPMTIIDTPGLNDSSGAEVRDHVQSLKTFLANASSQNLEIHAIGFVAQAHLVRLTSSERLVMDYVTTLFGEAAKDHFLTFVTFADNQTTPPVVEAMENYGIKAKLFYKLNNSTLTAKKSEGIDEMDKIYWRMGYKSLKKGFQKVREMPPLSVHAMKAVQSEIYATKVVANVEKKLSSEIYSFIKFHKSGLSEQERNNYQEKVWKLATVVERAKRKQGHSTAGVESILIEFVIDVCKELGNIEPRPYIILLSLAKSRGLWGAGVSLIRSLEPIYARSVGSAQRIKSNPIPNSLMCYKCHEEHNVERVDSSKWNFFSDKKVIGYKCQRCTCSGDGHHILSKELIGYYLDQNRLINHTKNCITKILNEFSIYGYKMDESEFIRRLKSDHFPESKLLCDFLKTV